MMINALIKRFPARQQLGPVFAIFVFFGFSWSLYRLFWYVPSWLTYLNIWQVLTIGAYVLAFGLLESALMTVGLVFFSIFFPTKVFKDRFVALGSSLAMLVSGGAVLLQRQINLVYRLELWQIVLYTFSLLIAAVMIVVILFILFERFPILSAFIQGITERMMVFTYIYVPLSLIGLLIVLVRNMIGS